jgi:hypothetical protein
VLRNDASPPDGPTPRRLNSRADRRADPRRHRETRRNTPLDSARGSAISPDVSSAASRFRFEMQTFRPMSVEAWTFAQQLRGQARRLRESLDRGDGLARYSGLNSPASSPTAAGWRRCSLASTARRALSLLRVAAFCLGLAAPSLAAVSSVPRPDRALQGRPANVPTVDYFVGRSICPIVTN